MYVNIHTHVKLAHWFWLSTRVIYFSIFLFIILWLFSVIHVVLYLFFKKKSNFWVIGCWRNKVETSEKSLGGLDSVLYLWDMV